MKAQAILHIKDTQLGEGPVWDYRSQRLWWVDILPGLLHCYDPENRNNETYSLDQMIGAVIPCEKEGLILALQHGLAFFDPENEVLDAISDPEEDRPLNRFNDGKCDPAGRLWAGTMMIDEPRAAVGSFYCLDPNLKVSKKLSNITISNGLAWTRDASKLYYIDTPTQKVQCFKYDNQTGNIKKEADVLFFDHDFPDGMCIDENDNLWIAFWGGGKVCCFNPETRKQLEQIEVPAERPTSCAFGGANLDTLFITSAAKEGDELGGALFAVQPGVKGRKVNFFKQQ